QGKRDDARDEKAVRLEKRSCAHAILFRLGVVGHRRFSAKEAGFYRFGSTRSRVVICEARDTLDLGNSAGQSAGEFDQLVVVDPPGAKVELNHEQLVAGFGKHLNFADLFRNLTQFAQLPDLPQRAVDQPRADRALTNRQQLMRGMLEISKGKV